jgi:hypothetical protein
VNKLNNKYRLVFYFVFFVFLLTPTISRGIDNPAGGSFNLSPDAAAQAAAAERVNAGNGYGSAGATGATGATEGTPLPKLVPGSGLDPLPPTQEGTVVGQFGGSGSDLPTEADIIGQSLTLQDPYTGGGGGGGGGGGSNYGGGGGTSGGGSSGSGGSSNSNSSYNSPLLSATTLVCNNGTCQYQMLAPIPGLLGDPSGKYIVTQDSKSLCSLLNQWFRIGIALAGMLAVVMIVLGGFQYATTDSLFDKSEGKEKIQSALWGLILALTTWLVLSTINPALTKCEIVAKVTNLQKIEPTLSESLAGAWSSVKSGAIGVSTSGSGNSAGGTLTTAPDGGIEVTANGVRIDSDGRVAPEYYDATRSSETSYRPGGRSMDATTEAYVVAPMDANGKATVAMGTPALIQNLDTGKQVWAVVGDAGSQRNGWGEISVYAAVQIGAADGKSDSAANHKIKITYYPNK